MEEPRYNVSIQVYDETYEKYIWLNYLDQTEQMTEYLTKEADRMGLNWTCELNKKGEEKK